MIIPVLMCSSEEAISWVMVTLYSAMMALAKENEIYATILVSPDVNQYARIRLKALEERFDRIRIVFKEVDDTLLDMADVGRGLHKATYYKLLAPKIIPEEKCIYLDADIIVELDLSELYKVEMGDAFVAGAADLHLISNPNLAYRYANEYKIGNMSCYINGGILVLNLDQMRRENIQEKLLQS